MSIFQSFILFWIKKLHLELLQLANEKFLNNFEKDSAQKKN